MTDRVEPPAPPPSPAAKPESPQERADNRRVGVASRLSFALQFFGSLAVVGGVIFVLVFMPELLLGHAGGGEGGVTPLPLAVEMVGADRIRIDPSSSIAAKLRSDAVAVRSLSLPLLQVTGRVAASLRPIALDDGDQWQFNDPEALEAYFEWQAAQIDIQFAEQQTERVRQLSETQLSSRRRIVERLRRLVAAGTDTQADLQLAEADLLEAEIEGRKEIHEADSDLRRVMQESAIAARKLQLMGLDVDMLRNASSDVDIVVAEVPEEYQGRVRIGQQVEARFFGLPGRVAAGTVQRISPTLSLERRSLRVLFYVDDPDDELRPGMFANIGLGTEPRDAILVPATAVIHIGRSDYVFARSEEDASVWKLVEVEVGDLRNGEVDILEGLSPNTEIIVEGAILLKPVAAAAVRSRSGAPL